MALPNKSNEKELKKMAKTTPVEQRRIWKMTAEEKKIVEKATRDGKEFFYIGHYIDVFGRYILKPGTTNDLRRRRSEHNSDYKTSPSAQIADGTYFVYDWFIPLSKYNTRRIEDRVKDHYKEIGFGVYLDNDRFIFEEKPKSCFVTIRNTYEITL